MKNKYVAISKEEFEAVLINIKYAEFAKKAYESDWVKSDEGEWELIERKPPIQEYCYYIPLQEGKYFIKIYSSVDKETSSTRPSGEDAIRFVASDDVLRPIREKFSIVKRIPTWKENFSKRIKRVLEDLGNIMKCSYCGSEMVLRKNKEGVNFLGCSKFAINRCRGKSLVVNR